MRLGYKPSSEEFGPLEHPALVAQATAPCAALLPGRFFLGLGTGALAASPGPLMTELPLPTHFEEAFASMRAGPAAAKSQRRAARA